MRCRSTLRFGSSLLRLLCFLSNLLRFLLFLLLYLLLHLLRCRLLSLLQFLPVLYHRLLLILLILCLCFHFFLLLFLFLACFLQLFLVLLLLPLLLLHRLLCISLRLLLLLVQTEQVLLMLDCPHDCLRILRHFALVGLLGNPDLSLGHLGARCQKTIGLWLRQFEGIKGIEGDVINGLLLYGISTDQPAGLCCNGILLTVSTKIAHKPDVITEWEDSIRVILTGVACQ